MRRMLHKTDNVKDVKDVLSIWSWEFFKFWHQNKNLKSLNEAIRQFNKEHTIDEDRPYLLEKLDDIFKDAATCSKHFAKHWSI